MQLCADHPRGLALAGEQHGEEAGAAALTSRAPITGAGAWHAQGGLLSCSAAAQGYEEAGTDLAQLLNKKETITAQKAAMSPDIAKALAKLANGLYVVTAAHSNQVCFCCCAAEAPVSDRAGVARQTWRRTGPLDKCWELAPAVSA